MIDRSRIWHRVLGFIAIGCVAATCGVGMAQESVGRVTLLTGTPRMPGANIQAFQPLLSGQRIETGTGDALGLMLQDGDQNVPVMIGEGSDVSIEYVDGVRTVVIRAGFVVIYHDEQAHGPINVETPFGRLTPDLPADWSGYYTVRHDLEKPDLTPARSTFSTVEGDANVEGISPMAGPYELKAGQMWVIRDGELPGEPFAGTEGAAAEALRDLLHKGVLGVLREQLAVEEMEHDIESPIPQMYWLTAPADQGVIGIDDVAVLLEPQLVPEVPIDSRPLRLTAPVDFEVAPPTYVSADLMSYGQAARYDRDTWSAYLPALNGNPAFYPQYLQSLPNAGFSYLQIAGTGYSLETAPSGEQFLAGSRNSGWAFFSPSLAIGDSAFSPTGNNAFAVLNAGLESIADGSLSGGRVGDYVSSGAGGDIQLDNALAGGYPILQNIFDTTGIGGTAYADQLAAIGSGISPLNLSTAGETLLFLSNTDVTPAAGVQEISMVNAGGEVIQSTELLLPNDRPILRDTVAGFSSLAVPLDSGGDNTVGLQVAPRGDVIAVIHHTGEATTAAGVFAVGDHLELVREARYSVLRWRDGARPTDASGNPIEFESLNDYVSYRNEVFQAICDEVNRVTPAGQYTICGPAALPSSASSARRINDRFRTLVRPTTMTRRSSISKDRAYARPSGLDRIGRNISTGSLQRALPAGAGRRYVGRNPVR